ncbi:AfsR/SARP family transcriptional regulator [Streptomyces sp. MAR4 CNX-425]|uniref:AfsR/SARP family transcriptional regulator n=1 Tax=Streptomyces sp. MAR4 CNX-425 TaxID=3406343 RepID=UPI003B506886
MTHDVEYQVLGAVEVRTATRRPNLNGKQRSLLSLLLLRANESVPVPKIMDALWGSALPAAPDMRVRTLVSELRKKLREAPPGTLRTLPSSYTLRVAPGQLDLDRFSALVDRAHAALAARNPRRALGAYDTALGLWRGTALGGTSGALLTAEAARLEELRLRTLEERGEALMAAGRHSEAIFQLGSLTADHPVREHAHALLMRAYFLAGHRHEALRVYHTLRRHLVSELGLEPMQSLKQLQRQILTGTLQPETAE